MTDARTEPKKARPLAFVVGDLPAKALGMNMADKAVLRCLVDHLNRQRNGTEVWPSNARIAELTGAHPDTVKKSKVTLHELGLIKIRRDSGKSDLCTINESVIRELGNPPGFSGGAKADPPEKAGEIGRAHV